MTWHASQKIPELQPAPMQQHENYLRTFSGLGADIKRLEYRTENRTTGTVRIIIRNWKMVGRFAIVARGPVWCPDTSQDIRAQATSELIRDLRRNCRGCILTPETHQGRDPIAQAGLLPIVSHGTQARLDISAEEHVRKAAQHSKWRNRLVRAMKADLSIEDHPMPLDPNHWILSNEADQAKSRGYKRLPHSFALTWVRKNGPKSARVFVARHKGQPVAGMLFLIHGKASSYHIGWTGIDGRALNAHNLLLWTASNWFAARGGKWIDLGTLDCETTPGLARFKLGAGAQAIKLGATWLDAPGARLTRRALGRWAGWAPSQTHPCSLRSA